MYEAYRQAIEFSGHLPYELVFDQQGGSKRLDAQDWFERIATLARHTAPGNAPSKSIELLFNHFQSQVLFQNVNFTGLNITARAEKSHVDMEFLLYNVEKLPTYQEVCQIYAECRKTWNAMPHSKTKQPRMEMYLSQVNDATVTVTEGMRKNLFMVKSHKAVKVTNHGIVMQWKNEKFTYEVVDEKGMPDLNWLHRNLGRHLHVEFDPHNPAGDVRLYLKDDYGFKYVCDAKEYFAIHRSILEQTHEERVFMRDLEWQNKVMRVRDYVMKQQLEIDHGVAPEQFGFNRPNIKGVTNKEFEKIFNMIMAEQNAPAKQEQLPDNAAEVLPDSIGKIQKLVSNTTVDRASYWDVV